MSRSSDLAAVFRGLESITRALIEFQSQEFGRSWTNSSLKSASETLWKNVGVAVNDAQATKEHVQQGLQDRLSTISTWTAVAMNTMKSQTSSMVGKPEQQPLQPEDDSSIPPVPSPLNQNETLQSETVSNSSLQAKSSHSKADNLDGHKKPDLSTLAYELQKGIKTDSSSPPSIMAEFSTTRTKPKLTHLKVKQELSGTSKERRVPASRIGRLLNYGGLAAGLGIGALAEVTRRSLGLKPEAVGDAILDSNPFLTEANAERIVSTLCRVRGAALKLGQMLSIQDNSFINPELQKIFERVRQSADFMPSWQMLKVIKRELGSDWKKKVASFDERPFAAASIGQVHRATLVDGREVAMKIQYPGVAQSIDSDINNLLAVMKVWKLLPEGLYIDNAMIVAKKELSWEVDYVREAECGHRFRNLLKNDPVFIVPEVIEELSTSQLLTSDYIEGISLDACRDLDQETRNMLGENILRLCLKELFEFNFMQTDPNWANFFYVPQTNQIALLDFGASREFSKSFVDKYIRVIKGASCNDREGVLTYSRDLGFLTGYETKIMEDAHVDTVMILGEAFATEGLFDFNTQSATERIQRLIPIMLKYRLSAPPEESYSLHRKMSGSFLLCTKLRSQINCKQLFDQIWESYKFQ